MPGEPTRGLLDTNILILRRSIDPQHLPEIMSISAISLAELSAGVHMVREDAPDARAERARRLQVLQLTEHEFDPITFDADAARAFGLVCDAVLDIGRTPRRRFADLIIAAVAAANKLPLYTCNPDVIEGLGSIVTIVPVPRPSQ